MDIDGLKAWKGEDRARQDPSVGNNDAEVGVEGLDLLNKARVTGGLGLKAGYTVRVCPDCRSGAVHPPSPSARAVGGSDNPDDAAQRCQAVEVGLRIVG